MGQAIVYCSNCSAQLRGADFESRRAFKVDDLNFCAKCCREILGSEPAANTSSASSAKTKALPASGPSKGHSSVRIPISTAPAPQGGSGGLPWILAGAGVAAVAVVIAVAMSGGGERPAPPAAHAPTPPAPPAPRPVDRSASRTSEAQEALAKALRSSDLEARHALLVEAVAKAEGTSVHPDAQFELGIVARKLELAKAEKAAAPPKVEEPKKADPAPPALVAPPAEPKPKPKPTPPPPPPDRSREEAARAAQWETALAPSAGRDYAAALAGLEKLGTAAADLPLLKPVAALHQEALAALGRIPRGTKIAVEFRDAGGVARRAEAAFVEVENGRLQLRGEAGPLEIEVGEISAAWLAENLRSRGSAVDPAAAALFCLLDGDEDGARRLIGDKAGTIPERYWAHARHVGAARHGVDTARTLYQEALALAGHAETSADAVPKFQSLLRDHAGSDFVRRNQASLASRVQLVARDHLMIAADLKPSAAFKPGKTPKGSPCWTSENDVDPAKLKDSFVDVSYSVLPDASYKCWVYAGACCQETFEFWVQGTEMKGGKEKEPVEPGSAAAAVVKPWLSSLKKTHSAHNGPKQPAHWEWVSIPLPKYAKPGLQQLRVLTGHKGFSVAYACVTATRNGPPRELDLRELEKSRGEKAAPAVVQAPKATVMFACAFDGTDRRLVGALREKALHGTTMFNSCWAGVEGGPVFTVPANGELRFTYYLKTETKLTVRFRIPREGATMPFDLTVPSVAGRPTEVRIPLLDFKPAYGRATAPIAPGDPVPMLYIFGEDINCGLRIDALSIVEYKSEAPVRRAETSAKALVSETFDSGPGRFEGGAPADGGINGSRALAVPPLGVSAWATWSIPVKDSVTISFKLKPLSDVSRVEVYSWMESRKDNTRYYIDGLKKGEWKEIRFKASELRCGVERNGPSLDVLTGIKLCFETAPADARILMDDFEIRE
jgi:hypothetical protein